MWWLPLTDSSRGRAEVVSVLAHAFPLEVHGRTFEGLQEFAGDSDDVTRAGFGFAVAAKVAEVGPAAGGGVE